MRLGLGIMLGAFLMATGASAARSQDVQSIAAIVNDDVISDYDLQQRVNLLARAGNQQIAPEAMAQLRQEALKSLIDERLELQEAKRQGITVSDEEVEKGLSQMAQHNGMSSEQMKEFFASSGIDLDTLRSRVRAQLTWARLVSRRFGSRVSVSEEDINAMMQQLKANEGRPERRIAEITLHVDSPEQEDQVRRSAQDLVGQLRAGAPFAAVAQQYSQSATAAVGGDVGWVAAGQLDGAIEKALDQMGSGQISDPVRTARGYTIVALLDQRTGEAEQAEGARYTLRQLVIPVAAGEAGMRDSALARARQIQQQVRQCADMAALPEASNALSGELGTVEEKDLPENFRTVLSGLGTGQIADPIETGDGVHVLMVCEKQTPKPKEPTRDLVEQQLTEQQLDMMARRYLRDLRRDALIEYRLAEQ